MMIFIQKAQVLGLLLLVSSSYHRHQRFIMVEGRRALRDGHRPSIDEEKKSRETAAMSSEIPSPRIIGGSDASPNLYNWFARGVHIGEDGDERWLGCGGSLVSPEFVLTAAHCSFDNSSGFQIGALCEPFGESDNCGQYMETIYAKEVFTHHKYENIFGGHDFQLVQLKSQSSIEPISMDQEDDSTSYSPGHPLWLIGFGAYFTFGHASLMPDHLQHVEVGYVDSDNCTEINAENGVYWTIKDNMMCAGNPLLHETEIGSCRGDSGGPLLDKESGKLVGVLSGSVKVGGECGKTPGVYGRISDQWPWIRETICESHSELNLPAYCENFTPYPSPSPTNSPTFGSCEDNEITVEVNVYTDSHPHEISWEIIDENTAEKIAGFEGYVSLYKLHEHQYCFPSDSCLRFEIKDSYYGDGIHPIYGYNVTVDRNVTIATSYDDPNGDFGSSENVRFGKGCTPTVSPTQSPSTSCSGINDIKVDLKLTTDYYTTETTWDITDIGGNVIEAGSALPFESFEEYEMSYCVDRTGCYSFNMYDSYYDGIDCGLDECYIVSYDGSMIFSGSVQGESGLFGDGCPTPSMNPSMSSTPSTFCSGAENATVLLELTTDDYYAETTWDITDIDGNVIEAGSALTFDPFTEYDLEYCVDKSGCYSFNMYDYYSDGISCGLDECYKVSYEGSVVLSGTDSGESGLFGEGCPSMNPSISSGPSILSLLSSPSAIPTSSPVPTSSLSPTSICGYYQTPLYFSLNALVAVNEVFWGIHDETGTNLIYFGSLTDLSNGASYEHVYCLNNDGSYIFTLYQWEEIGDFFDGTFGNYYYSIYYTLVYGDSTIREGDDLKFASESTEFGDNIAKDFCDGANDSIFSIDLSIDDNAGETSWDVKDIDGNTILSSYATRYARDKTYRYSYCLAIDGCYTFTIYDSQGNGICCGDFGDGSYTISYQNVTLKEGGDYKYQETTSFGNGCIHSSSPSLSSNTSIPSLSPSQIQLPTVSPSRNIPDVIFIDDDGRREYPYHPARQPEKLRYEFSPNCSLASDDVVGCVAHPRHDPKPSPDWAGKLHSNHTPICSKANGEEVRKCEIFLPMSQSVGLDRATSWKAVEVDNFALSLLPKSNDSFVSVFNEKYFSTIAVGDLNGDGLADLIYGADFLNGQNEVVYLNGEGHFEEPVPLPGGRRDTTDIKLADLDGDGYLDIVIANYLQPNQALFNKGDGNFDNVTTLPGGSMSTTAVSLADIDLDGNIDIVFANFGSRPNQVLYNDGDGGFTNAINLPGGNMDSSDIKVGDLDGNGLVDLVISNRYRTSNQILYNIGHRTFEEPVFISNTEASDTLAVELGDVDGDNLIDIVLANNNGINQILYNNGDRSFTEFKLPGGTQTTYAISIADLDGNGLLDLVFGNRDSQFMPDQVLYNTGDRGRFDVTTLSEATIFTTAVVTYDFNGDGFVDVVFGNGDATIHTVISPYAGRNLIFYNDQKKVAKYDKAISLPVNNTVGDYITPSVALGDANNDGLLDIFLVNEPTQENGTAFNQVMFNMGEGQFELPTNLPSASYVRSTFISLGDLDNDGNLDVLIARYNERNQVFYNKGGDSGEFEDGLDLPGDKIDTRSIKAADLNNDGWLDIVVVNNGFPNQVLLNKEGSREYELINLPGGSLDTRDVDFGDFNNDGSIDIVFANAGGSYYHTEPNQLLFNSGNGTFLEENVVELPGEVKETRSIVVGDVDSDGLLDIVIANRANPPCQVYYNNGDRTFEIFEINQGESTNARTVTLSDLDLNGFLDIIVGFADAQNYIIYNDGTRHSLNLETPSYLPGAELYTLDIALGDIDGDGYTDLLVGNGEENQVMFFSTCPNGGAKIHTDSWCFRCLEFMGRPYYFGENDQQLQQSLCRECLPDYMQDPDRDNEVCSVEPCFSQGRPFGDDSCASCLPGTYYNSTLRRLEDDASTWSIPRCRNCETGTYSTESPLAIDRCFDCIPGQFQNGTGKTNCIDCAAGFFQVERGQDKCDPCDVGGYCDALDICDGGFTPCNPGTYNDLLGQDSEEACIPCPAGTYSTETRGNSSESCLPCNPGEFGNETGQTSCIPCEKGTYQPFERQMSCLRCEAGTYADNEGFVKCIECPYRLSSLNGSSICSFCDENFYLNDTTVDTLTLFRQPLDHCFDCPTNATCPINTTLQTIGIPENFWRDSLYTSELYECKEGSTFCKGMTTTEHERLIVDDQSTIVDSALESKSGYYCQEGYTGLLCEVCVDEAKYFNRFKNECEKCDPISQSILRAFLILIAIAAIATVLSIAYNRFPRMRNIVGDLSIQAKLKVLISFLQLVYTFHEDVNDTQGIYGIQLDSNLLAWLSFLQYLSLDIFRLINLPIECIGSMQNRVIIGAVWPYIAILAVAVGQFIVQLLGELVKRRKSGIGSLKEGLATIMEIIKLQNWSRLLYTTIFLFYFVLPIVSMSTFEVINCEAFKTRDEPEEFTSYLIIDPTIECDSGKNSEYSSLLDTFWAFFVLWPVLVPILFVVLLFLIRSSVRSKRITPLANACRFLWGDYTESMYFWDVMETIKRIFLSGFIMFVDPKEGSNKILRLIIAVVICTLYMGILTLARPYKRTDDLYLAFISNYLLICYFGLGIILHFCESDDTCARFVGLSLNSYRASILVVILILSMTFLSIFLLLVIGFNTIKSPVLRLAHTKEVPNLELPVDCTHHVYISYCGITGDDKAQSVALKLQMFLPDIIISFNVDEMGNQKPLQQSISDGAVFIIVYSRSYFKSKQAQDEIRYAMELEKPVIVLYEGSEKELSRMRTECADYCYDDDGHTSEEILDYAFEGGPILWLNNTGVFTATSLNLVYKRILSHLPYYKENPSELEHGLKVPGEIDDALIINSRLNIYVSEENIGSYNIAREIKEMMPDGPKNESEFIVIKKYIPKNANGSNKEDLATEKSTTANNIEASDEEVVEEGGTQNVPSTPNTSPQQANDDNSTFVASLKNMFSSKRHKESDETVEEKIFKSATSLQSIPSEFLSLSKGEFDEASTLTSDIVENGESNKKMPNSFDSDENNTTGEDVKEIFLLYLNSDIIDSVKNTKLSSIIEEVLEKSLKIVIVFDAADQTPFSFYWQELTKTPYDPLEEIVSVPIFGSNDHRRTSLRKTLSGAFEVSTKSLGKGDRRIKSSRRYVPILNKAKVWSI